MLFKKKKAQKFHYDPDTMYAVVRCSICTGEQVAGFKNKETGHFTDVMLIEDEADIKAFMKMYGIKDISKEY